ncbi:hypothetical protein Droror1_Dr00016760 [Drosera rotundifolia]
MALSRLRHPVISRAASSLLRARLLSSSAATISRARSIHRYARVKAPLSNEIGHPSRPESLPFSNGYYHHSFLKLQIGLRYFSSAETPPHLVIGLPALSPTMSQGNIAKWRKKEGDKIAVGDVLCEIETDKATLEFEILEEGYLAKILVPEGSKDVQVGQPIAVTVEDLDDIQNVPATFGGSDIKEASSDTQDVEIKDTGSISTLELPPHVVLGMPALSPTMNQGNIATWRKKEGEKIEVGDIICEIETDKATLEYESLEEGYLAKILAPEGSKDVAVGDPIAVTVEDLNDIEAVQTSFGSSKGTKAHKLESQDKKLEVKEQKNKISRISPSAKLLISEFRLDVSSLSASGPHGTLLKGDVLAAIKSGIGSATSSASKEKASSSPRIQDLPKPSASPEPKPKVSQSESFEDLPNSQIRKVIARRLLESKQTTPHLYLSADVILDPLLSFRKELIEKHNVKVSVNDIVIKAVAVALRNVPSANAFWNVEKGEVTLNDSADISIAVATERGLMTPIVKNADQKTISTISSEVKELAEKARTGRLMPHEFQGGTFSISNLGMFPVDRFCAIINPPQSGILAVGRGNKVVEAVVGDDGVERPAVVTKMNLTLSADHRVFDGKVGGEFLSALKVNFSDIQRLLL